jgi:hypothetical protein
VSTIIRDKMIPSKAGDWGKLFQMALIDLGNGPSVNPAVAAAPVSADILLSLIPLSNSRLKLGDLKLSIMHGDRLLRRTPLDRVR